MLALRPGSRALITDVCVPISALAACIAETQADLAASSLLSTVVGHVGDGNFHTVFLVDPDSAAEIGEARALNRRMVERALEMGGTCTGEHGIGHGKREYLRAEHGDGVDVMVRDQARARPAQPDEPREGGRAGGRLIRAAPQSTHD